MGLLDEAIREHLELKRRCGADPQELARQEEEALQPIGIGELPAWAAAPAPLEPTAAIAEQETAELDMATVLGDASASARGAEPASPEPFLARRIAPDASVLSEDLEWEMPSRLPPAPASPGASRESFALE